MDIFTLSAIIISLSALFGYLNVKVLKLPNTIGLMIIAIVFTLFLFASSMVNNTILQAAEALIGMIDFKHVLLDILLGFLLFAGALHTNFDQLRLQRWPVIIFSTLGVVVSTFLIGSMMYYILEVMGLGVRYIDCLLFGALISPTDPIAVLGILKKAGVPKKLEAKIVGESLFNDGVGVVIFLTILSVAQGGAHHGGNGISDVIHLFGQEVFGGIILGGVLGYITFLLLRSIDDYEIEVMITLACVMGGYSLAHHFHLSAPLAMVVAGLVVGNDTVRDTAMSDIVEQYVDKFWELIDMLLNAVLFVLIGLEMLVLSFKGQFIFVGLIAIIVVLLGRYLSLIIPIKLLAKKLDFVPHTDKLMTWGGLRGGISIALALSLPQGAHRELFIIVTYVVVVFSIIVQGLTVGRLAKKLIGNHAIPVGKDGH